MLLVQFWKLVVLFKGKQEERLLRFLSCKARSCSPEAIRRSGHRGTSRRRIQIKSHQVECRPLQLRGFTTQEISFRIDRAVRSFTAEANPADEYRLFTTYDPSDETVGQFLEPAQDVPQLLLGVSTQRYRLLASQIWPKGGDPLWPHLAEIGRDIFASFCARFVIEIGCPHSSTTFDNRVRRSSHCSESWPRKLESGSGQTTTET